MISKELLSEVLGEDCVVLNEYNGVQKYLVSRFQDSVYGYQEEERTINIHELAHKCKEWAYNKNYWISSGYAGDIEISDVDVSYPTKTLQTGLPEPEAVFEACEWVLEQEEKG